MGNYTNIVQRQQRFFQSRATLAFDFRRYQLRTLKTMLMKNEQAIYDALHIDLHKSAHETFTTELGLLYTEINFALKRLKKWMSPIRTNGPITHKGCKSMIYAEPYGTALIISPWNYPLQLALAPAIAAIAAGNTILLKPSEFAPKTSALLLKMVDTYFSADYFAVIEGDKNQTAELMAEGVQYIFFTGSTGVGKKIMQQAAKTLTPVTLELGGKSPAIINSDANITLTAKRIVWGKFTNAGQTCVAPDYLYVHESVKTTLIEAMIKQIKLMYGKKPLENSAYTHIIHDNHFKRLQGLLTSGEVIYGGQTNLAERIIAPTLIDHVTWNDPIMREEIFGPLLPIMTFTELDDVIDDLRGHDKPLSLYYFGENAKDQQKVVDRMSFGGGCINDTLYHLASPYLPFGGVGMSGMGSYHGKYGFDTFSHQKSIVKQTTKWDIPFRYPGKKIHQVIAKRLMK